MESSPFLKRDREKIPWEEFTIGHAILAAVERCLVLPFYQKRRNLTDATAAMDHLHGEWMSYLKVGPLFITLFPFGDEQRGPD